MCGIFGAINGGPVTNSLLTGLQSLSYRGYDSAGIAVVGKQGLERRRSQGKLNNLASVLKSDPISGTIGIAHTRWATHGAPNKRNAHPHMTLKVAVAHNGIIENYQVLRNELYDAGYHFKSDTDSEVIPLLITRFLDLGFDNAQALRKALNMLDGSFAVAVVFSDNPNMILAARQGSPLVLGKADGGFYLASDANALANKATTICHLEDGDIAQISREQLNITDKQNNAVTRAMQPLTVTELDGGKQGYRHYMLKEIHEQPEVFKRTIAQFLESDNGVQLKPFPDALLQLKRLSIIACGTSYYAGNVGKYWLENIAALPVDVDIASERRYRKLPISPDSTSLFISQSGETADTLAALRQAKQADQNCISIVNVINSNMAHESDELLKTLAGPEIGVASTKAFTAQLAVLLTLTLAIARNNKQIDQQEQSRLLGQMLHLPEKMRCLIEDQEESIEQIASQLFRSQSILYLGRGIGYPLALEGALKLKEISYIHAEAYPSGELKHGPIALVDDQMPVIVIAPPGELFAKSLSNLREVSSRGAKITLISDQQGADSAREYIDNAIVMPDVEAILQPILYTLPLQLLAYHIAVLKGTDVDQPRNLAKSVTVE